MLVRHAVLGAVLAALPTLAVAQTANVPQFTTSADAATKCSSDTVVWASGSSKALHPSGDRYFGKTKHGFYTCEKQALAGGFHMAGQHHKKHAAKTA